jgi:2-desacetyl-2-hydroxyethyl bacteriochlorophyllide A dehydrogenase
MAQRLKQFLNRQAGVWLERAGYSDAMVRDAKREGWWWLQTRLRTASSRRGLYGGSAVTWTGPGAAELVPIEIPRPGPGEVTVEILASAVSPGTERAQYLRLPSTDVSYPYRPGYSVAGVVLAAGRHVHDLARGDLVAAAGVSHDSIATLPESEVLRVPEGVEAKQAAFVQLGVIAGQGVGKAQIETGARVCVLGAGLVGALAHRLAQAAGAGEVTVVASSRRKERSALDAGAARFLVAGEDDEQLAQLGAEVVIEATGDPDAVALAVDAAAPGARIVLLGSPRGTTTELPVAALRSKQLELVGAHVVTLAAEGRRAGADLARAEAEAFLDHLASGRVQIADLVQLAVDPREADSFYRDLAHARDLLGAYFDWSQLPREDRVRSARLASLPNLRGRGLDPARNALRPRRRMAAEDPFEGARGRLRVGLLGCGDIAVQNAAAVAAAPNAELVACFDPIHELAEELASAYGAQPTPTAEALLDRRDVDAVILSVPHHLHAPLGRQAAEAGKHLIIEKPLAQDLAAARELAAAAEAAEVVLSVCFPHRYDARIVTAKRLVDAGALGRLGGSFTAFFADKPASYWLGGFTGRSISNWRTERDKAGGGVLIMNLSHYVDLVRYVTGVEADQVAAVTRTEDDGAEVEDTVSLSVAYANGAVGSLFASAAQRGFSQGRTELRFWGSDGHIQIEPEARLYTLRAIDGLRTGRWHELPGTSVRDIRAAYISRFATAVAEGRQPDITAADGLAVQAFIEAAYRAADQGSGVSPAELLYEVTR